MNRLVVVLAIAILSLLAQEEVDSSALLQVTRTDDPLPAAPCLPEDCSLRGAILEANESDEATEINLPAGQYVLRLGSEWYEDAGQAGDLDIAGEVSISGGGSGSTVLTSSGQAERAFDVRAGAELTLSGVSIRNLHYVFAPLDCGRAIRNSGLLTVERTVIAGNQMRGDGGGICNEGGTVDVVESVISGNCACLAGRGGGIYNSGGAVSLSGTIVKDNTADWLAGGGVFSLGELEVDRTAIVRNSTRGPLGERQGGGIFAEHLSATNSTFSGNSTPSVNASSSSTEDAHGGGVYLTDSGTLVNSTVTNNAAGGSGAGLYLEAGADFEVVNSIIAENDGNDCDGQVTSLGSNLTGTGTCAFAAAGDLIADPQHASLLPSAGSLVHPLLSTSLAVDAGRPDLCPDDDQRGVARPRDGDGDSAAICDIGAYEMVPSETGDVDCDGTLTGNDALRLLRSLALIDGPICISSADVNTDESIDTGDVLWILKSLLP